MECEVSHNDLERFFLELAPRLETARVLDRELDRQLARRFNALDYLRKDELGLSRIIADLLNPEGNHGQGAVFLQLLLDKVGFKVAGKIDDSRVDVELTIGDQGRLDIAVQIDERHCLAIENKPYAGDQHRQVEKYLEWLDKEYDKHMLVYLSRTGEGPTEDSIGKADLAIGFAIMPYYRDRRAADLNDEFKDFRMEHSLADWLADCRRNCDVDRLRWFLRDAETFCQQEFGGNTMTSDESCVVKNFMLGDGQNVETAFAVHEAWPAVRKDICERFLERIRSSLQNTMDTLVISAAYSEERYLSHISAHSDHWPKYSNGGRTSIALGTEGERGNNWIIGVQSPLLSSEMEEKYDQLRRERLEEALGKKFGRRGYVTPWWPWWERVERSYRCWDPLIPMINWELENRGGEITDYFVKKFTEIAEITIPIINLSEKDSRG